jgi:hypothetical protein
MGWQSAFDDILEVIQYCLEVFKSVNNFTNHIKYGLSHVLIKLFHYS